MMSKSKLISSIVCLFISVSIIQADTTIFDANAVISDGDVYDIVVVQGDNTVVDMTGGEITGGLFLYDTSAVNITGGIIDNIINIFHSSTLNTSVSINKNISLYDNSKLNIYSGANITKTINTRATSILTFYDGIIIGYYGGKHP